ncbi:Uncharacterised protein (plasmid) [Legionella adelaidensis]|uniref:Uncharacterized protein n=2 Tax=Legionella adelaidensis TaxID=45056 RepID=A0A0W0R4F1_9GAMM|nr:hypothetical protein Lade_0597 [Legionella adelaidensis]VEH85559.1 Uncharacterised protein [Legionella adelaidensis]
MQNMFDNIITSAAAGAVTDHPIRAYLWAFYRIKSILWAEAKRQEDTHYQNLVTFSQNLSQDLNSIASLYEIKNPVFCLSLLCTKLDDERRAYNHAVDKRKKIEAAIPQGDLIAQMAFLGKATPPNQQFIYFKSNFTRLLEQDLSLKTSAGVQTISLSKLGLFACPQSQDPEMEKIVSHLSL